MTNYFYRYFYRGHGTFIVDQKFDAGVIGENAMVVASICELGTNPFGDKHPFVGDARMTVHNVAPQYTSRNGQPAESHIFTRVEIAWPSDLDFQIVYYITNL